MKPFKKTGKEFVMLEGLTKTEQREIKQIIAKAKREDKVPRTAQQSIPFERMFQDGICRVGSDYYTKTM